MNKKCLTIGIIASLASMSVWAAGPSTDKATMKFELEAQQLAHQMVSQKLTTDQQQKQSVTLDVNQAVGMALASNTEVLQAQAAYDAARAQVGLVASAKNPVVTYTYSAGRAGVPAQMSMRGPVPAMTVNQFKQGVGVTLPLYTGGAVENGLTMARANREIAGATVMTKEEQAKLTAAKAYYTLIMARNKVDIAKQAVKDYEGHLKNVNAQYKVGIVAKSDVLATETALANAKTGLVKAKNGADLAEASLANAIGLPVTTAITPSDTEMKYVAYPISLEMARTFALSHRMEVVQAAMAVKAAEAGVAKAQSGDKPTVAVQANKNFANDTWSANKDAGWNVGAGVTWKLWDGGNTKSAVSQAKAQVNQAKEKANQAIDGVLLQVRQAYLSMRSAEQTIESTKAAVKQGEENFRIATLRYRAGVGTNLDVLDAETVLEQARNNHVDALYNYNIAVAELEQAMGVPVTAHVGTSANLVTKIVTEAVL